MSRRFVYIWFQHLKTDGYTRRYPPMREKAFVLTIPDHGRKLISAVDPIARSKGIYCGMVVADARVIDPGIQAIDEDPTLSEKWLKGLAEWCIRYAPFVSIDLPDGLIIDATGCAHLWGGEANYLAHIITRLHKLGYHSRASIADTVGAAWAIAHFDKEKMIVEKGQQYTTLLKLPVAALRLDPTIADRLVSLGLKKINSIIGMQRSALRRRFGEQLLLRLDQLLGNKEEFIEPVIPVEPYQERLPSIEPIVTVTGIGIALRNLLENICTRLQKEQKGLRLASFKCYRIDGKVREINIGTIRPSYNSNHLEKLFEWKIGTVSPGPGIDLFILEAQKVEPAPAFQEKFWQNNTGLQTIHLAKLVDRFTVKFGAERIHRYLPQEHHWPERSFKAVCSLEENTASSWNTNRPRPIQIMPRPELIQVTAPVPDYPPMNFRYRGKLHKIIKADGPERIEQEWWLQQGQHRDYYVVEDEEGNRYWIFRLGHYGERNYQWFLHGFFA